MTGDPLFRPPEMMIDGIYNEKSDIFSLGLTIYYLLTGKFPFDSLYIKDII